MSGLRVKSLALGLRLPDQGRDQAARLREVAERRFMPAVLAALRAELDRHYGPEAVIRIPYLRLRLTLGPDSGDAAAFARQLGQELAAQIRATIRVVRPGQPAHATGDEARLWPDRAAFLASGLIAAARGLAGPEGRHEKPAPLAEALCREPAQVVASVLLTCAGIGAIRHVLAPLPETVLRQLRAAGNTALPPEIHQVLRAALARTASPPAAPAAPGAAPEAVALDPAASTAPRPPAAPPGTPTNAAAPAATAPAAGRPRSGPAPATAAPKTEEASATPPAAPPRVRQQSPPPIPPAPPARRPGHAPPPAAPTAPLVAPPAPILPPVSTEPLQIVATGWGGVVYLLNLARRLEMPEALWRIGLPEGEALAGILATATGAPEDPAVALPAPGFPRRPPPLSPVPDWARAEFRQTVLTALRDLAGTDDLPARIEARRAALAEDASWRLADWAAAALLVALEDLLRPDPVPALSIPGQIEAEGAAIRVLLPLSAIDLGIRRAGLDANPGDLPWLDRRITLLFGTGEEDWSP